MKYWTTGLIVFTVLIFTYSIFNGTPWGKENMRKESSRYLQDKYGDEMKIESVEYDFDNSFYFKYRYYTVVHLKKNPQIQFQVNKYKEKLTDNYYISYWEYEVKNEIKQQFHQISSVSFQLRSDPSQDRSEINGIYPPNYHEIKKEIKEKDMPELRLWISVNDDKQEQIMNAIFEIVLFLKDKDYRLSTISFMLDNQTNNESYYLSGMDLKEVTDLNSLTNMLK
ncbi:hypothetical protein [Paenibacillus macerans]|uniref:YfjL-like protein n=1 Tax=Paenibacillus macerans TaxID=44252 RepID=UPI002040CA39|nr:hypothetical protein [Paenibacillus macerans]MCM3702482.1 hypothetical protein [Paenibacillus macerans]